MSDIIIYNDGELELDISVNHETVWLNRNQISELLGRDVKTIGKHISNVFKENELLKSSVVANFATTAKDDKKYDVEYYNLDVVISVGNNIGTSLKDLGKKWFAFSRLDIGSFDVLDKIEI